MEEMKELIIKSARSAAVSITNKQTDKIEQFIKELLEWNEKHNLTGAKDINQIIGIHVRDSLLLLRVVDLKNTNCFDFGSGAGFPGIIIALMVPEVRLSLIESNKKKASFLKYISNKLDLDNVKVFSGRAEDMKKKKFFDFGFSRATGNTRLVWEVARKLLKIEGKLVYWKGKDTSRSDMDFVFERNGKLVGFHAFILNEPKRETRIFVIERTS